MNKCVNHELTIIFNNDVVAVSKCCNKCKRTFSKELVKRIMQDWKDGC